ncbi:MAG: hypothetical protein CM15mV12_0030 [uncultured marine virus]|nr:MAG: hypothetical protein CM15mV12_0030 [uncultured marine virus]
MENSICFNKKQAAEAIAEVAQETGQYFVNYRWLGGMLTN